MIALLSIIIGALTITGLINRTRAILSGRKGYRFFQPLLNVGVLMRKSSVYSNTSSMVSRVAAPIYLSSIITAALMLPLGGYYPSIITFDGDIVIFCLLIAFSRLSLIWAAMDSGSSFQAMGASRESLFALLLEPAMFLLMATLCLITRNYSFSTIFAQFDNMTLNLFILSVVVGYGFLKLSLAECGRVPIDDTRTHLELTMIHEVIVLDMSGVDLAFIQIGGWFKLSIFSLLVVNSLIPPQINGWLLVALYAAVTLSYGVIIGTIESFTARNRMNKNATYIVTISAIGLLAFIVSFILNSNLM